MFLITLSSHFPFNDTEGYGNFDVGEYEKTLLGDYLKGIHLFMHFPNDTHKGVNHTYSGQIDLLLTLANMFNLPARYVFGKDIMNTNTQYVIFREGSFTDGKILYDLAIVPGVRVV